MPRTPLLAGRDLARACAVLAGLACGGPLGCDNGVDTHLRTGGHVADDVGEGEGETGVVIDCGEPSAGVTLSGMADRYATELYPLMARDAGGCIECHHDESGRQMTMTADAKETFYRQRANGYWRLTTGMIAERIVHESMPAGGPPWSDDEKEVVVRFSCDLASIDEGGVPVDEQFPEALLAPWTGPANTDYDNTFLTYAQLRKRVIQVFDDDWVREGVDEFSENIALFGGVDFINTFVPARQATPEFLVGLDLLAEDVCGRAAADGTGPFAGLDLDAPVADEPPSALTSFEAEAVTITGLPDGCMPGPNATTVGLCTNASVSTEITVPASGDYTLVARVRGMPNGFGAPIVVIRVDSEDVLTSEVPETTMVTRTVTAPITAGTHTLAVAFVNDSTEDDGDPATNDDRNLIVDSFSIEGPVAGTTDGSPTGRADALAKLETLFTRMLLRAPVRDDANALVDEVAPLHDVLTALESFDGDRRGAWAGVCQGLLAHPDFLFTRPPAFDTATGDERERLLLIKSALDLVDRPPNEDELLAFAAGAERMELVEDWLDSDEMRDAYYRRVKEILESDGTNDGNEPARLWAFVMAENRPLKEILTADYTVDGEFEQLARPSAHGATGLLTMKGYITGKPGLPHFNYAARVLTGFMGVVFEVPQEALDARATATAASTVDPSSICYSCHRLITPLAHQRQKWDDAGNYRTQFDDGRLIDDSDQGLVADYPFTGPGIESFSLVAVRKVGFLLRMANVHFQLSFGRNLRHEEDERVVFKQLWDAAESGNGTFKDVIRGVLASSSYVNPPPPTEEDEP